MKILIAGFGSIGRRHLRNLLAMGQNDIVLYRSGRSTLPTDEIGSIPVETSLKAALAHKPEAVIVANPTALHLDVAIPAAEAGCHLFLEKPVTDSLARVDELRAAMSRSGARALVGFQFRFHPGLRRAALLLQEGAIGKPVSAQVHWGEYLPDWHPWEDYRQGYAARADLGGGVVRTLSHPLDYLRWLMGEVKSAHAITGQVSNLELTVEDVAEIGLRFVNGALGNVHLNYIQRPPQHTLQIVGTNGTLQWDNSDGMLRVYAPEKQTWTLYAVPEGFDRNVMFMDETRHFLDVVQGKAEPVCTLEDGIRVVELIQQIMM